MNGVMQLLKLFINFRKDVMYYETQPFTTWSNNDCISKIRVTMITVKLFTISAYNTVVCKTFDVLDIFLVSLL